MKTFKQFLKERSIFKSDDDGFNTYGKNDPYDDLIVKVKYHSKKSEIGLPGWYYEYQEPGKKMKYVGPYRTKNDAKNDAETMNGDYYIVFKEDYLFEKTYEIEKGKIKCPSCGTIQSYEVKDLPSKIYHGVHSAVRKNCEKCGKYLVLYTKNENDKKITVSLQSDYGEYLKSLETPEEKKSKEENKKRYIDWSTKRKERMGK